MKTMVDVTEAAAELQVDAAIEPDVSEIPETSFRRGIRNPYLVLLAPDVHRLFPNAEAANAALRAYAQEHGLLRGEPRPA